MASPRRVLADLKVFIRGYTRSKIGLFFSLVFPIILILLFGDICSGGNGGPINVYVENRDGGPVRVAFVKALDNKNTTRVTLVEGNQNFSPYLLSHSANQGVLIPPGFTQDNLSNTTGNAIVYTNPSDTSRPIAYETVNRIVTSFKAATSTRSHS